MAFDNGEVLVDQVAPQQSAEQMEAALKDYFKKVQDLTTQEKNLRGIIADLNSEIDLRKQELQGQYSRKVNSLGSEIEENKNTISSQLKVIGDLSLQIEEKEKYRDAILTDFSERELSIKRAQMGIDSQLAEVYEKTKANGEEKTRLAQLEDQVNETIAKFNTHAEETMAAIEARRGVLKEEEDKSNAVLVKIDASLTETNAKITELNELSLKINKDKDEAFVILAAAQQVQKDLAFIASEKQVIKDRQAQLDNDAEQIRIANMALAGRKTDLDSQERLLKEARKQLGG